MYKLANEKILMGFLGKRITSENVNSFPERILKIWEKAGHIKVVKTSTKKEEEK